MKKESDNIKGKSTRISGLNKKNTEILCNSSYITISDVHFVSIKRAAELSAEFVANERLEHNSNCNILYVSKRYFWYILLAGISAGFLLFSVMIAIHNAC